MRKLHFPVLVLTITLALSSCSTDDADPTSITVGSASSSSPTEAPASSATPSASAPSSSPVTENLEPSNATIEAWLNGTPQKIADYPMHCETDGAHVSAYLDIPDSPKDTEPVGSYWADLWVSDGRADVLSVGVNYGVGSTTARAWHSNNSTGAFTAEVSGNQYTIEGQFPDSQDGMEGESAKLVVVCQ